MKKEECASITLSTFMRKVVEGQSAEHIPFIQKSNSETGAGKKGGLYSIARPTAIRQNFEEEEKNPHMRRMFPGGRWVDVTCAGFQNVAV